MTILNKYPWFHITDHTPKLQILVSKIALLDNNLTVNVSCSKMYSLRCAFDIGPLASPTGKRYLLTMQAPVSEPGLSHSLSNYNKIIVYLPLLKCPGTFALQMQMMDSKWIKVLFLFLGFHGPGGFIQNFNGDSFQAPKKCSITLKLSTEEFKAINV